MSNVKYHLLKDIPKVGDKVFIRIRFPVSFYEATVEKVTPTGIVRTNLGSFKRKGSALTTYGDPVLGGYGSLVEPTKEVISQFEKEQAKRNQASREAKLRNKAYNICSDIRDKGVRIPLDLASRIVNVYDEWLGELRKPDEGTEISTVKTVTEWCAHCEYESTFEWDTSKHGFKVFCPHCGSVLMLCDECRHGSDDAPWCDWDSKTGKCFRCGAKDGGETE